MGSTLTCSWTCRDRPVSPEGHQDVAVQTDEPPPEPLGPRPLHLDMYSVPIVFHAPLAPPLPTVIAPQPPLSALPAGYLPANPGDRLWGHPGQQHAPAGFFLV